MLSLKRSEILFFNRSARSLQNIQSRGIWIFIISLIILESHNRLYRISNWNLFDCRLAKRKEIWIVWKDVPLRSFSQKLFFSLKLKKVKFVFWNNTWGTISLLPCNYSGCSSYRILSHNWSILHYTCQLNAY